MNITLRFGYDYYSGNDWISRLSYIIINAHNETQMHIYTHMHSHKYIIDYEYMNINRQYEGHNNGGNIIIFGAYIMYSQIQFYWNAYSILRRTIWKHYPLVILRHAYFNPQSTNRVKSYEQQGCVGFTIISTSRPALFWLLDGRTVFVISRNYMREFIILLCWRKERVKFIRAWVLKGGEMGFNLPGLTLHWPYKTLYLQLTIYIIEEQ